MQYIPGGGPFSAKVMMIGDCPTPYDTSAGKYFTGTPGKELDRLLHGLGIRRDDCWLTAVCKYEVPRPGKDHEKIPFGVRATRFGIDMPKEIENLYQEINAVKPNLIIAFGSTALGAVAGRYDIGKMRGSIISACGIKTIPTYHPNDLIYPYGKEFKDYYNRQVMIADLMRCDKQKDFPEIHRPPRNIQICKSSHQFQDFIDRHKSYARCAADIEAIQCVPGCIGLACRPSEAIVLPLWNNLGNYISDSDYIQCMILLARFLHDKEMVGQNFKYDEDKIIRLGFTISRLISDTMLKCYAVNPELPVGLAFNTSIYTEEPFYKDEGMYEGSIEDLLIGCGRDACVTMEIDNETEPLIEQLELKDFYYNFLMNLHPMYLDIESEGFLVSEERREVLLRKYINMSEQIDYDLFHMIGDRVNVQSPKQIAILLYEVLGIPNKGYGTGEEVLTDVINSPKTTDRQRTICEKILDARRIKKTIGTYLMAMPDYDGRMRTTYFLCTDTGRTSTGQQEPPIRPIFEYRDYDNKKKKKALGTAFQTMTKHGDIGQDIRSMYVCDPDEVFIQADSEQAEARVVFLLANDEQALEDIDKHDYHALTTSWFFGGKESDYSKKVLGYESPQRFIGKTLRHAGHLGAGKKRAASEVNTMARKYKIQIQITEAFAELNLKVFHKKQPSIQGVFHASVIEAINKTRHLIAALPYGIPGKFGGRRTFFERWGDELNRQAFSYIPQRSVTDNTKSAGIRIRKRSKLRNGKRWIKIVCEAHDALLVRVKERDREDAGYILQEEMQRPIRFENCTIPRRDLIVPCSLEIGYDYQNLDKFKIKTKTFAIA